MPPFLVISMIPNQQEPSGDPTEITNVIRHVRPGNGFEPTFPLFARFSKLSWQLLATFFWQRFKQTFLTRADVNGATRIPLYQWALVGIPIILRNNKKPQSRCPSPIPTFFEDANLLLYSPMSQEDIRWNWEKASPAKYIDPCWW